MRLLILLAALFVCGPSRGSAGNRYKYSRIVAIALKNKGVLVLDVGRATLQCALKIRLLSLQPLLDEAKQIRVVQRLNVQAGFITDI